MVNPIGWFARSGSDAHRLMAEADRIAPDGGMADQKSSSRELAAFAATLPDGAKKDQAFTISKHLELMELALAAGPTVGKEARARSSETQSRALKWSRGASWSTTQPVVERSTLRPWAGPS